MAQCTADSSSNDKAAAGSSIAFANSTAAPNAAPIFSPATLPLPLSLLQSQLALSPLSSRFNRFGQRRSRAVPHTIPLLNLIPDICFAEMQNLRATSPSDPAASSAAAAAASNAYNGLSSVRARIRRPLRHDDMGGSATAVALCALQVHATSGDHLPVYVTLSAVAACVCRCWSFCSRARTE